MENIYTIIGKRIREERKKTGLTQIQLSKLSGVHYSFIGYIERGHKRLSVGTMYKVATALCNTIPTNKVPEHTKLISKQMSAMFTGQVKEGTGKIIW